MVVTWTTQGESISVLVADDDQIFRSIVVSRLDKMGGSAIEAEDGVAAWRIATVASLDLAIIDLAMPNLDGFELIACMREHPRTRHLPIIVITAHNGSADIERALRVGATSFLTKPVNWATFEHHIGFLLRLAEADRKARSTQQLTAMLARARDAILRDLSAQVQDETCIIRSMLDLQPDPGAPRLQSLSRDSLREVCDRLSGLQGLAQRAIDLTAILGHEISVSDRCISLDAIVAGVISETSAETVSRDVMLRVEPERTEVLIACDGPAIETALAELVRNAIQHSPPSSLVELSCRVYPDGLLAITIVDNGAGMSPDLVASVASPLSIGLNEAGRSGIGIVLAKAVAEAHGGTLEIQSVPESGTTARLIIPSERVKRRNAVAA